MVDVDFRQRKPPRAVPALDRCVLLATHHVVEQVAPELFERERRTRKAFPLQPRDHSPVAVPGDRHERRMGVLGEQTAGFEIRLHARRFHLSIASVSDGLAAGLAPQPCVAHLTQNWGDDIFPSLLLRKMPGCPQKGQASKIASVSTIIVFSFSFPTPPWAVTLRSGHYSLCLTISSTIAPADRLDSSATAVSVKNRSGVPAFDSRATRCAARRNSTLSVDAAKSWFRMLPSLTSALISFIFPPGE